jgi:hypothetical protein
MTPVRENLRQGELQIETADKPLHCRNDTCTVLKPKEIGAHCAP